MTRERYVHSIDRLRDKLRFAREVIANFDVAIHFASAAPSQRILTPQQIGRLSAATTRLSEKLELLVEEMARAFDPNGPILSDAPAEIEDLPT